MPASSLTELVHDLQELPELELPLVYELRPAEPTIFRQIWLANEAVFAAEPQRSLANESSYQAFLEEPRHDPALWSVIWSESQIAGVAFSEVTNRNVGHISQLSVGEQWRRQSLGLSLVLDSLHKFRKRGVAKVYVSAGSGNAGAMKLYQKSGFRPNGIYNRYQKPWVLME